MSDAPLVIGTRGRVAALLRYGKTVAWTADATGWPRDKVMATGHAAGLAYRPEADVWTMVGPQTPQQGAADGATAQVVTMLAHARGLTSSRSRTLVARLDATLAELDKLVAEARTRDEQRLVAARVEQARRAERAAKQRRQAATVGRARDAAATYPTAEVRRWARDVGMACPGRGRYLPDAVVSAWRAAHAADQQAEATR